MNTKGVVYLVEIEGGRLYKIGATNRLEERMLRWVKNHPKRYKNSSKVIGYISYDDCFKWESFWQKEFQHCAVHKDFFLLNENEVQMFLDKCDWRS